MIPGVVVVGSASRDLAADDPRGWRLGGAVSYAGLALARLGLAPRVLVGGDPLVAAAAELDVLRAAGAEVVVAELDRSPVFDNAEVDGVRRQRCLEPGVAIPVSALPARWREVSTWLMGPVAGELGDDWAAVMAPGATVGLGWQGLLRRLVADSPTHRREPSATGLSRRADLVVVSREDLEPGTDPAGLGAFLRPGARLVVTDGAVGGSQWRAVDGRATAERRYPAIAARGVADPTGAGDAFLAGLVAAAMGHPLAGSGRHGGDLRLAAAVASLTVEGQGLAGVPALVDVAGRLRESLTPRAVVPASAEPPPA